MEPEFLDRTGARFGVRNVAFICVPVIHNNEVIGTMSIDRAVVPGVDLGRDLGLLETVANITAEAVATSREEHAERERLLEENRQLKQELRTARPPELIGNCSAMHKVYAMISQVANSDATVMIRGASGTGKELVAKAIRSGSRRKDKPFVVVNCAALPEYLIESELFGHEKGAFAGASSRRTGLVESADTGTLFLDEVADLPPAMQVKLLRFLQDKSFSRAGSNVQSSVNVRIIASTSRNLEELISSGGFREDLYYRLNVFPIILPELRERKADIVLLAEHFLNKYSTQHKRRINRISTPTVNMMMAYHWPGNVRELENCMERAVLASTDNVIHGYDLPPSLQTAQNGDGETSVVPENIEADFNTMVGSFERELIVEALKRNHGNVAAACRTLRVTPRIIHYKIRKLGINPKWYIK
jgi:Nif-specific regulatory protein